jgi:xanthosine utilization system XapX-like protein
MRVFLLNELVSFAHPVKKLWIAFWIAVVGVIGKWAGEQLLQAFPQLRERVHYLAPPDRAVLPISLSLFVLGLFGLLLAYRLSRLRKKQREIAAAAAPPARTSSAFTSEDIMSMAATLPPDPDDPIDHEACNVRLDKNFFG